MKRIIYLFGFLLLFLTMGNVFAQKQKTKYVSVPVENADKILAKKNMIVLDVRTLEELQQGYVPGAINYNFNGPDFKEQLSALPKNKPYFVYCRSGKRSGKTVEMMKGLGFKKVYEMRSGFPAYDAFKKKTIE